MLIVFEGVDSSGKATHTELVYEKLKAMGKKVVKTTFPDYESESSALVKMYLGGRFGENPADVSPYAASAFYAVDRYASYVTKWKKYLDDGYIVVADRYVPSNMIHQAAKFENDNEKNAFLDWVYDFEYVKLGLPVPDRVFFLDMPPEYAKELMRTRANKITGDEEKDIHERDDSHILKAYNNAVYVADKRGWAHIRCTDGRLKTIDEIQDDIMRYVLEDIKNV